MMNLKEWSEKPVTWKGYFEYSAAMSIIGLIITAAAYLVMFHQNEVFRFITEFIHACIKETSKY